MFFVFKTNFIYSMARERFDYYSMGEVQKLCTYGILQKIHSLVCKKLLSKLAL